MAKFEIEVFGTQSEVLMDILGRFYNKVTVTELFPDRKGDVFIKLSNRTIQPQPPYSRQEVLSEKWKPFNYQFYFITSDNHIFHYSEKGMPIDAAQSPTLELAEAIVRIREGKHNPIWGEEVYICSFDFTFCSSYSTQYRGNTFSKYHYFPTPEQRDAFIAKNKPKYNTKMEDELTSLTMPQFFYNRMRENNWHPIKEFTIMGYKYELKDKTDL